MKNIELATHLIAEQIRNRLLMDALEDLGFDCSLYSFNISHIILELLGFEKTPEALYEKYFKLVDQAIEETAFWNLDEMMRKWSRIICNELSDLQKKESDTG